MYRGDEESGVGSPLMSFNTPNHPRLFVESIPSADSGQALSEAEAIRMTAWVLLDAHSPSVTIGQRRASESGLGRDHPYKPALSASIARSS